MNNRNLYNYYKNIITYDLITKFNFQNIFEIFKIKKIYLNIGLKKENINKKNLMYIIGLLKLITNQMPSITVSKKNNIFLKIKKNEIIGCKILLHKKNINNFLEKFLIFIHLNNNKNLKFTSKNKNIFNFKIKNIFKLIEFQNEFIKFKNIPSIDVSVHTNTKNNYELFTLLNHFYILNKT